MNCFKIFVIRKLFLRTINLIYLLSFFIAARLLNIIWVQMYALFIIKIPNLFNFNFFGGYASKSEQNGRKKTLICK